MLGDGAGASSGTFPGEGGDTSAKTSEGRRRAKGAGAAKKQGGVGNAGTRTVGNAHGGDGVGTPELDGDAKAWHK